MENIIKKMDEIKMDDIENSRNDTFSTLVLVPTNDWGPLFVAEMTKNYFKSLESIVKAEYTRAISSDDGTEIYPAHEDIFRIFFELPCKRIKVVIIGQDPYIKRNQATGMAFSVPSNMELPPSLKNIFKVSGQPERTNGDLINWVHQGVFLYNTILTVRRSESESHKDIGWEIFSENVIRYIISENGPDFVVFMLWGKKAHAYENMLKDINHVVVLKASHPSPLGCNSSSSEYRSFMTCNHFKKCNKLLVEQGFDPIDWTL